MDTPNVQPNTPPSEPSVWLDIADELRKIAYDIEQYLAVEPAPRAFSINIQPFVPDGPERYGVKSRAVTTAAVDAVALGLLGKVAETKKMGDGTFHRHADALRGPIEVRAYQRVADPAAVDPDEEIARLRAENEQLRAALAPASAEPNCTPACDALQSDPQARTGLDRPFHSDDCPVPVHHVVLTDGGSETACGVKLSDLPPAHGYVSSWSEPSDFRACAEKAPF